MIERRSLSWPITLGVTMIVLLVALTVGWILVVVFGAMKEKGVAPVYWTLLVVGTIFFVLVLVGVVLYLALTIKAVQLTQRQSNFIDAVTHELKSPIASLKLYLQTLNRRRVSPEEQENFFRFMLEDVERLDRLISHLLEAARVQRPPTIGELNNIELSALIRRCADEVRSAHQAAEEQLQLDLQECRVRGREADFAMIFRNLIDNAFKYGGDPARVEVACSVRPDGLVVVEVHDNGPGIPPGLRRKIFGRFVRLGLELERQKPGTGLGLYLVHTLIRRQKGTVRVHDRLHGTGTTFEIRLPGVLGGAAPPPPVSQPWLEGESPSADGEPRSAASG